MKKKSIFSTAVLIVMMLLFVLAGCTKTKTIMRTGTYNSSISSARLYIENDGTFILLEKPESPKSGYTFAGKYTIDGNKLLLRFENEGTYEKEVIFEIKDDVLRFEAGVIGDNVIRVGTEFSYNK